MADPARDDLCGLTRDFSLHRRALQYKLKAILINKEQNMVTVKRIALDILKPHRPNALEFAMNIASQGNGTCVRVTVIEVDEKTETISAVIEGENLQFDLIQQKIKDMGGSLHSIDEVDVCNEGDEEQE